jgi:hypothetical protein
VTWTGIAGARHPTAANVLAVNAEACEALRAAGGAKAVEADEMMGGTP